MSRQFADRVTRIEPSATVAVSNLASELEADGVDVVDLSVGEPDFPTPEVVSEAAKDAIDEGHTGYAPSNGIPELRSEVAAALSERGLDYDEDQLIVTPGGKQGLFETFQALVDEGSEVVLLDPAWVSYEAMAKIAGADLSRVDLTPYDFQLEPALDDLAETVSDETALLVVNSPNNPTGAVYSEAAMEGVRDLAVEHDLTVISDEIYDRITYEGVEAPSLGALDGMGDRTVTLNGFSKAYSMTGWRLGYIAAPDDLIDQAGKLQSHSVTCATHFVQHAGVTALRECDEFVAEMRDDFAERREMLADLFADHGVDVPVGDGAFYMMVPVDDDDQEWCERAIQEAHVAMVPGSAFGTPGYARLSYAASEERLREGVERLADNGFLG
jgi:aspartate aminotransferase